MLTRKEMNQLKIIIEKMSMPITIEEKEICYKNDMVEILETYVEEERDG